MALGRLQWRLSQFPNAAASFEQAANADRKNAEAALLAVLSLASASGADARDRQIEVLTRWVQASPDNQRAWYLLALERGAANDIAGEIEALKKAISLNPKDPGALQNLGVALALQRDFPGAEQQLEQALQQAGGKPGDILAAQGFVASLDGKTEVAQEKLRNAVSTETSIKNQAQTRLGLLLLAQGRFDDAESYLADAALSNKDNVSAQFFYAACLQAKGLMPEALRAFEGVAQKQGPLATEALIRVADLQLAQGNTQQAREVLDKAEAAGASGAAIYTVRGRLHAAVNEDDRAREWFQKALKADANCAAAHLESGLLYVKQQNLTEGIRELDRYLSLVGANRDGTRAADVETLISHLKQAEEKQGRPGGAAGLASRRETS
jgi:tetratricopeptide (TPR) repeat protein